MHTSTHKAVGHQCRIMGSSIVALAGIEIVDMQEVVIVLLDFKSIQVGGTINAIVLGIVPVSIAILIVGTNDILHVIISITWPRHLGGRVITNIF